MTKVSLMGQDKKIIYTRYFNGSPDDFLMIFHSVLDDLLQAAYSPAAHKSLNDLSVKVSETKEIKAFSENVSKKDMPHKSKRMKTTIVSEGKIKLTPMVPGCFYCDEKKCELCACPMISMAKTAYLKSTMRNKSK